MGNRRRGVLFAATMLLGETGALAADCPEAMVCASDPPRVISVLEAAGYKAQWLKSRVSGNPMISAVANGTDFEIFFYGCVKGAACTSLGFSKTFREGVTGGVKAANAWNRSNRFGQMAYDPDSGAMTLSSDLSTKGGIPAVNFADVVDWWVSGLVNLRTFFDAQALPGADETVETSE